MGNVLEHASAVNYAAQPHVLQFGEAVIRTRVVDEPTQIGFTLTWNNADAGTIEAVREFYRANRTGTFEFTVPDAGVGGGATLLCEFITPPRIARRGYQSANVSVQIRRALMID